MSAAVEKKKKKKKGITGAALGMSFTGMIGRMAGGKGRAGEKLEYLVSPALIGILIECDAFEGVPAVRHPGYAVSERPHASYPAPSCRTPLSPEQMLPSAQRGLSTSP
jgi:hypothetical protein